MGALADRRIPGVSNTFLSAVDWALAVRPQDRPQDVAQFRAALNGQLIRPTQSVKHESETQGEAAEALTTNDAVSFPSTVRWIRPAALRRHVAVLSLIAGAGVAGATAMAWSLAGQTPTGAVALDPEPAAKASTPSMAIELASLRGPPAIGMSSPPMPSLASAPDALRAEEPSSRPSRPLLPGQRRTAGAPKPAEAGQKAWASSGHRATRNPALAKGHGVPPGPIELCSGRNFFVRPYCIQHRCDEPRFKANAECLQLQQVARARRD
jgi:hypothetical protein